VAVETASAPVTDELIELNGLRFHFRDWPSARPDAPPLLLLHGFMGHSHAWDRIAGVLRENYRVLALDQRGHGETAWASPDGYTMDGFVGDVAQFVAALGLQQLTVVGHSLGGRVGFFFAGTRPTALQRLVVSDIGPITNPAGRNRIGAFAAAPADFDTVESAIATRRAAFPNEDPDLLAYETSHGLMRTHRGRWTWRFDPRMADPAIPFRNPSEDLGWQRLGNIAVPMLLIHAEMSDVLSRETADRMVATAPDCRLVEIPGCGHGLMREVPQEFLDALHKFL
jgi:pimeloyl-ACP methyl ester carboxylesterase